MNVNKDSLHSRPPLERMLRIHQSLQSGKFPNASTLARKIEVSTKSIHRDIEFMRDRLGLPIEYDSSRTGYRYTEEVSAFPNIQITEGELFALIVAEKALQQYRGTSFEKPLLSAIKKMEQSLPETISLNLADKTKTQLEIKKYEQKRCAFQVAEERGGGGKKIFQIPWQSSNPESNGEPPAHCTKSFV